MIHFDASVAVKRRSDNETLICSYWKHSQVDYLFDKFIAISAKKLYHRCLTGPLRDL